MRPSAAGPAGAPRSRSSATNLCTCSTRNGTAGSRGRLATGSRARLTIGPSSRTSISRGPARGRCATTARARSRSCSTARSTLLLDVLPAVEAALDFLLESALLRLVVLPARERGWQTGHVRDGVRLVMRVLVVLAVGEVFHQLCRRVAQMQ